MQASVSSALVKNKSILHGRQIEVSKTRESVSEDMEQKVEAAARSIYIGNLDSSCDAEDIKVHKHFHWRVSTAK